MMPPPPGQRPCVERANTRRVAEATTCGVRCVDWKTRPKRDAWKITELDPTLGVERITCATLQVTPKKPSDVPSLEEPLAVKDPQVGSLAWYEQVEERSDKRVERFHELSVRQSSNISEKKRAVRGRGGPVPDHDEVKGDDGGDVSMRDPVCQYGRLGRSGRTPRRRRAII
jgi:hypothetical protein